MKQPLIVVTGPTAVGKTALSIELAKAVNGEIISADSMQVYRYMDIGSAKVTKEEMQGIPHHLIDVLEPWDEFHVVRFQEMAKKAMKEIWQRNHIPIITGGTGFYIQALLYDIDFTEAKEKDEFRKKLEEISTEKGASYLHELLRKVDPESAKAIHENNIKRVIRALEFHHQTGEKISIHNEKEKEKESPYDFLYFVISDDRNVLYDRIEQRIDSMITAGLVEEVRKLKIMGCTREMVSMQGLGYKEILDYLDGIYSLEEAVEILKRDTRHFAKRQLTWFKRERNVKWLNIFDFSNGREGMLQQILIECRNAGFI